MNRKEKYSTAKLFFIGGHATPAYAVLEVLRDKGYKDITWVSEKYNQRGNQNVSVEFKTVTEKYKLPFISISTGKLVREFSLKSFIEVIRFIGGLFQAFKINLKHKPDIIISFGGFLAVPIVITGRILGKKVITHEQTIATGLATRIIAKFADTICVSWEPSMRLFPKHKLVLTGNPLRKAIFEVGINYRTRINSECKTLYITGGNQGAHEINKRIFPIIIRLLGDYNVIHQTGNSSVTGDYGKAKVTKQELPGKTKGVYIVQDYFHADQIGEIYSLSDLIISRGGANTTLEFLALGKVAIIIPIPWLNYGEQEKNADYLENIGLGKKLQQNNDLTPDVLMNEINSAFDLVNKQKAFNGKSIDEVKKLAQSKVKFDAAEKVVEEIEKLIFG